MSSPAPMMYPTVKLRRNLDVDQADVFRRRLVVVDGAEVLARDHRESLIVVLALERQCCMQPVSSRLRAQLDQMEVESAIRIPATKVHRLTCGLHLPSLGRVNLQHPALQLREVAAHGHGKLNRLAPRLRYNLRRGLHHDRCRRHYRERPLAKRVSHANFGLQLLPKLNE